MIMRYAVQSSISSDLHVATPHTIITESGLRVRIMNILTVF